MYEMAKKTKTEPKTKETTVEQTPNARVCASCGAAYESPYSGSKYCPTCAEVKKKERKREAAKRRKSHRKDELNDLRTLKADIDKIIRSKATDKAKVEKITSFLGNL